MKLSNKSEVITMDALEPKKLALIRVLQILKTHSDFDHPLTQEDISKFLEKDYGIVIERKAISRNLSLLREAGYEIESTRVGSYLAEHDFEDSELRLLIDGVLSSKHITARHSKDLIEKLCNMSNRYFRAHIKNIYSVNDWSKTDNQALFYNIEMVDVAIEQGKQIRFDFNKYGMDKKLHRTKAHTVSPYQLILHNQRYYLMAFNEYWGNMSYYRLDHITNMTISDASITPITKVEGYKNGIDYKEIATAFPYLYNDKPETIEIIANKGIIDQMIDWFGKEIKFTEYDENNVKAEFKASPTAMSHWATQYINMVEVIKPTSLREKIKTDLQNAIEKYNK